MRVTSEVGICDESAKGSSYMSARDGTTARPSSAVT
ncbi:Uncharacterised protein [Bordetella pertussis]|nr:Uncharacterised protein [Bordetella pertussis]CFN66149.1 Uncharacterised protein [Bordetella pertussis]CFN82190.1 Uncharacterised protein [Bordetella pertussis]CFO05614.1 Uncharacterised protein [Bordetella pertussis]CFO37173.1 Uncharacterised protein [Bordetella pertussis]